MKTKYFTLLALDSDFQMIGTVVSNGETEHDRLDFEKRLDDAISEHFDVTEFKREGLPAIYDHSFLDGEFTIEIDDYEQRIRIMRTWMY